MKVVGPETPQLQTFRFAFTPAMKARERMGPKEFAEAVREERDTTLAIYADASSGSAVSEHLRAAKLTEAQRKHVLAALNDALTDTLYNLLVALDGSATIGGQQQVFKLTDESGREIASGDGRLEAAAWTALRQTG